MAPFSKQECFLVLGTIFALAPGMGGVKSIVELIANVVDKVDGHRDQAGYLLKRCTELCIHVNEICLSKAATKYLQPVETLKVTLNKIHVTLENLSKTNRVRCYLQRGEIADIIKNSHRSLDDCLRLFEAQALSILLFDQREYEDGRKEDDARLLKALGDVSQTVTSIKEMGDRILDVIYGLRNDVSKHMGDDFQQKAVDRILARLSPWQDNDLDAILDPYWIISSCQISFIEGDQLEGGDGTVSAGRWNRTKVAVKKLQKGTSRELLRREFNVWRRLQHPHVASFLRACTESEPPLLISELYEFGNLLNYLDRFPEANRSRLCHEIALGMCFLHNEKVIHGDLKPTNVLVDDGHHVRIAEFGLSKVKSSSASITNAIPSGSALGKRTWAFIAPELLQDNAMSFTTDVYAFATSVYQVMTGKIPFQDLSASLFYDRVVEGGERPKQPAEGDPSFARGLDESMWDLLLRCWAHDRQQRPSFDVIEMTLRFCASTYDRPLR